jgi:hypothetical protein
MKYIQLLSKTQYYKFPFTTGPNSEAPLLCAVRITGLHTNQSLPWSLTYLHT